MNNISCKQDLTANALKIIAILAMTMDHIAISFVMPNTVAYQLFRMVGKLTIVIMCYMIVEGYNHTHNVKKYLIRLFMFAVISHIPFVFYNTGKISLFFGYNKFQTSVIWTLFLGLASLCIWNKDKFKKIYKIILLIFIGILAMPGDWSIFAVLLIWGFGIFYGNKKMQMLFLGVLGMFIGGLSVAICVMSKTDPWYKEIFLFGLLLAIPIFLKYNGKPGTWKHTKWIFYVYYPLHLIILRIIAYM